MWASLYPVGSVSREIINRIQNTYYLVNLVDNDYIRGNCLFKLLDRMLGKIQGDVGSFERVGVKNLHIVSPEDGDELYEGEPLLTMTSKSV